MMEYASVLPAKKIKTEPTSESGIVVHEHLTNLSLSVPVKCNHDTCLPKKSEWSCPIDTKPQSVSRPIADCLLFCEQSQCHELSQIAIPPPVQFIYNPLSYAEETHTSYVRRYGNSKKKILFLGMNPGPYGMAQNGVPFGDTDLVKDWLHISGQVGRPDPQHPRRPISGLDCKRKEVSGSRFWGLMRDLCSEPQTFFRNCYVHNYCPLCFMGESGKNITPPSLRVRERRQLEDVCDRALLETVEVLGVKWIVCIGRYVEVRARKAITKQQGTRDLKKSDDGHTITVCNIMHPSPINPLANKGWAKFVRDQLSQLKLIDVISGAS